MCCIDLAQMVSKCTDFLHKMRVCLLLENTFHAHKKLNNVSLCLLKGIHSEPCVCLDQKSVGSHKNKRSQQTCVSWWCPPAGVTWWWRGAGSLEVCAPGVRRSVRSSCLQPPLWAGRGTSGTRLASHYSPLLLAPLCCHPPLSHHLATQEDRLLVFNTQ